MKTAPFFAVAALLVLSGCAPGMSGFDATQSLSTTAWEPGIYEFRGTVQVQEEYAQGAIANLSTRVRTEHVRGAFEVREDGTRRLLNSSHRETRISLSPRGGAGRVSVLLSVSRLEEGDRICMYDEELYGPCRTFQRQYYERQRDVRLSGPAWIESTERASR